MDFSDRGMVDSDLLNRAALEGGRGKLQSFLLLRNTTPERLTSSIPNHFKPVYLLVLCKKVVGQALENIVTQVNIVEAFARVKDSLRQT